MKDEMNNIIISDRITLSDIIAHKENYPVEVLGASIEVLRAMSRRIREASVAIEGHVIESMQEDGATKLHYRGVDGDDRTYTLKNGSYSCTSKKPDEVYRSAGFDPLEIGEYVFKPSWSKAKEARKVGGVKQKLIDELFKQGRGSLG